MLIFEKLKSGESYRSFKHKIRLYIVFETEFFYITSSNHYKHNYEPIMFINNIYYHSDLNIVKKSASYKDFGYVLDNLVDIQLELSIENRKRKIEKLLKDEY